MFKYDKKCISEYTTKLKIYSESVHAIFRILNLSYRSFFITHKDLLWTSILLEQQFSNFLFGDPFIVLKIIEEPKEIFFMWEHIYQYLLN